LEDTRKTAVVFMDAADTYQEGTEKQIKAKAEELEDTRKADVVFIDAVDRYKKAVEKQIKAMVEELKETRKAVVLFMDVVDTYQVAEKQKRMENDRLQPELLIAKKKYSLSEVEIKRLRMELGVLAEANETATKAYNAEKAKMMKVLEEFTRKVEKNQASKEATEEVGRDKDSQADKLRVELEELNVSMSQLRASYEELYAKHSCLNDEKNSIQGALDAEKMQVDGENCGT
jgi:chromosome segregation ATPase